MKHKKLLALLCTFALFLTSNTLVLALPETSAPVAETLEADFEQKEPLLSENYEMIVNGDFSIVSEDLLTVEGWSPEPGKGGTFDGRGGKIANDGDSQGNYVIVQSSSTFPQVRQKIQGLLPGAEYRVVYKYRNTLPGNLSFSCQMQFLKGGKSVELQSTTNMDAPESTAWRWGYHEFVCPDDVDGCRVSFRNLTSDKSSLCIDDVSFYMTKAPCYAMVETDERFYYTEWDVGYVNISDRKLKTPIGNGKVILNITDEKGTNTFSTEYILDNGNGKISFPILKSMPEKGIDYTVKVEIYNAAGQYLEEHTFPITRFDRPTYLGADGVFRKPDRNGNIREINLSLGNNTNFTLLDNEGDEIKDIGITVVQMGTDPQKRDLMDRLDAIERTGRMAIISLYYGKQSGGHPDRLNHTMNIASTIKDHPAFFAYKLQDEPIQKMNTEEELAAGYKAIRNIDPDHPVYLDDSGEGSYKIMARVCDWMDIDYYPGNGGTDRGSIFLDKISLAIDAVKGRKPVTLLQQGFENVGTFPTSDEYRNYWYQTLFAGGAGAGYHDFGGEYKHLGPSRPQWPGLVEFAKWEQGMLWDCFVNKKYPMLNEGEGEGFRWRTYVKDGKIYAFIINTAYQVAKAPQNTEASFTLLNTDGAMGSTGYTAKRLTGGPEETITVSGTTLNVSLAPQGSYIYEITPDTPVDFSALQITKYRDLLGYSWAFSSIVNMENKGIVNDKTPYWYGPGDNITRGDLAMFLVRALGLTGNGSKESFSDVYSEREYAEAIAIGKAAGILNGVGDNKFNPDAEISRQDMMTIISRGMQLAGETDLSAFYDNAQIADYAVSHVKAMIACGLVKGNADGSINPKGNTTRAEAAVIMQRIVNR